MPETNFYADRLEAIRDEDRQNFWGETITPALRKAQQERHAARMAQIEAMPDDDTTSEVAA
jgi:hypothetical protein